MPCGGIYPIAGAWPEKYLKVGADNHGCFHCGKHEPRVTHFCDEWDCYLHKECIDEFLITEEGKIVIAHGHEVIR